MAVKGPFVQQYLQRLKDTIDLASNQYSRVLALRIDIRLPQVDDPLGRAISNLVITRFFESFESKIQHNRDQAKKRNKWAHDTKVRYVWAREFGRGTRPHWHVVLLLNGDAFYKIGRFQVDRPTLKSRLDEAWASALGCSVEAVEGLIHHPVGGQWRLERGDQLTFVSLFHRASYICKAATKQYGDRSRSFGCSRG
jgi:hypothetical protein